MKLLLKILFFIIAIFSTNISEAKVVVFDNVVLKIISIVSDIVNTKESTVILENEFGIICKSQCVLLAYRNWGEGFETVAAKGAGRVFWAGGDVAKNAAMDFAKANGMKTLEMTTGVLY